MQEIVLFGAGNVAGHLSKALVRKGLRVIQVVNRSPGPGKILARTLGAVYIVTPEDVTPDADLYILAVSDSAIARIAGTFHVEHGIVVHTSGSVGMDVLRPASEKRGVFYPLQTFCKGHSITFSRVPLCIEGSSAWVERTLLDIAGRISSNAHVINSEQRKVLHLAAVFAGNFTNYLYTIAEDLVTQYDIPFDLLAPLIRQTASNIRRTGMFSFQTGPAIREERAVIDQHLELLADHEAYRDIYDLITRRIIQHRNRNGKL